MTLLRAPALLLMRILRKARRRSQTLSLNHNVSHWNMLVSQLAVQRRQFCPQRLGDTAVLHGNLGAEHLTRPLSSYVDAAEFLTLHSDSEFRSAHALNKFCGYRRRRSD